MTAVGINGLGRIGRLLARRMYERDDARHALELVMCNEVADVETVVHLSNTIPHTGGSPTLSLSTKVDCKSLIVPLV